MHIPPDDPADPDVTGPLYSERLDEAVAWALRDFRHIARKGRSIPYIAHLFSVMARVAEHGGDEDQLIAAVLHDWLEDVDGDGRDRLAEAFGERVARLVEALSDTTEQPKPPWRPRKEAYLATLPAEPPEVKLLCAADKLHNAESLLHDLRAEGLSTFDRFNGGLDGTLWYHRRLVAALGDGWDHPLHARLAAVVDALHEAVRAAQDGG